MRVYELAERLRQPTADVIALLRTDGEWVASHLSTIAEPVARVYLKDKPRPPICDTGSEAPRNVASPQLAPVRITARQAARTTRRRRPGPAPVTLSPPGTEPRDLSYLPELTTRDVAALYTVTPATVRQWVQRGYLKPVRRIRNSNVFANADVHAAYAAITGRSNPATNINAEPWYRRPQRPLDRLPRKDYSALITVNEAAILLDLNPSTIRSWIHRGHLTRRRAETPGVFIKLSELVSTADGYRAPRRP